MKKNGFTLIELLAVIIILGILMVIVVPSVSKYIDDSKKKAYVATIKDSLTSAGTLLKSSHMNSIDRDATYYVPITCIKTEKGTPTSPYNDFEKAYIIAGMENNNYSFYFVGRDKSNVGVKIAKKITELTEDDIESDLGETKIDKLLGNTTKILLLDETDCTTLINH